MSISIHTCARSYLTVSFRTPYKRMQSGSKERRNVVIVLELFVVNEIVVSRIVVFLNIAITLRKWCGHSIWEKDCFALHIT